MLPDRMTDSCWDLDPSDVDDIWERIILTPPRSPDLDVFDDYSLNLESHYRLHTSQDLSDKLINDCMWGGSQKIRRSTNRRSRKDSVDILCPSPLRDMSLSATELATTVVGPSHTTDHAYCARLVPSFPESPDHTDEDNDLDTLRVLRRSVNPKHVISDRITDHYNQRANTSSSDDTSAPMYKHCTKSTKRSKRKPTSLRQHKKALTSLNSNALPSLNIHGLSVAKGNKDGHDKRFQDRHVKRTEDRRGLNDRHVKRTEDRRGHNELEKRRREDLKQYFTNVEALIPHKPKGKLSKLQILQGAIILINSLKKEDLVGRRTLQIETQKKRLLQSKIRKLVNKLQCRL